MHLRLMNSKSLSDKQPLPAMPAFAGVLRWLRLPMLIGLSCIVVVITLHTAAFFSLSLQRPVRVESSTFPYLQIHQEQYQQQLQKDGASFLPLTEAERLCRSHGMSPYPSRQKHRKVYDLFLIGTEMDWAEIRMNELAPYVDYFVILEAASTFTNRSKPLHFKNNWADFSKFTPQIIYHVLVDDAVRQATTWDREYYSRNALLDQVFPRLLGAQAPNYGDVILISDVDEIPRPQTISSLRNCDIPLHVQIQSRWYLYSFQWHAQTDDWPHPQASYWKGFRDALNPESIRMATPDIVLKNASWSCTTCFKTVAQVVNKIKSFSHQELDKVEFTNPVEIVNRVRKGLDVFDRKELRYEKIVDNLDVPQYLRRNQEKFAYLLDRDPLDANFVDWDGERNTYKRPR